MTAAHRFTKNLYEEKGSPSDTPGKQQMILEIKSYTIIYFELNFKQKISILPGYACVS